MKPLRIGMLSPIHWRTPPTGQGAWELVASNITEELVKRGHDVTLFATADSQTAAKLESIAPHPLLDESGKDLETKVYGYLHAALPFETAERFDIIHNHYDGYPLVFSKLVKTPVVTTIHGFSSPQVKEIYRKYNQTHYVSISDSDRKGCPDLNYAATVHHGVDTNRFGFEPNPDDYACFIGRIHPTKGTHTAIRVAREAGVPIRIAGHLDENDPAVKRYWEEQVKPLIDGRDVRFMGELDEAAKIPFIQKAVASLTPIDWEEPFGMVFIEAMACGTPTIAFRRGSVPEIIEDGVAGIQVEPGDNDAMVAALKRIKEIDRAGVRKHAEEHFSIPKMVDKYEAVYSKILGL